MPNPNAPPEIVARLDNVSAQITNGLHDVKLAISQSKQDIRIVVELDTRIQEEILATLKEIRKHQQGLTSAQEDKLARDLDAVTAPLQAAVEANQPPTPST